MKLLLIYLALDQNLKHICVKTSQKYLKKITKTKNLCDCTELLACFLCFAKLQYTVIFLVSTL